MSMYVCRYHIIMLLRSVTVRNSDVRATKKLKKPDGRTTVIEEQDQSTSRIYIRVLLDHSKIVDS
jgi:hypothetical protein